MSATPNGSIWIEGSTVKFVDGNGDLWKYEGAHQGSSSNPPGSIWIGGQTLYYADEDNTRRAIRGEGGDNVNNAIDGSIWIESSRIHFVSESKIWEAPDQYLESPLDITIDNLNADPALAKPGTEVRFEHDASGSDLDARGLEVYYCGNSEGCDDPEQIMDVFPASNKDFLDENTFDEEGLYRFAVVGVPQDENNNGDSESRGVVREADFLVLENTDIYPTVTVEADEGVIEVGDEVTFTLDASYEGRYDGAEVSGGDLPATSWRGDNVDQFGDAGKFEVTVSYDSTGTKTVEGGARGIVPKDVLEEQYGLKLHEDVQTDFNFDSETVEVVEAELNAVIDVDPQSPEPGESVTFDGTESSSPNGDVTSYLWEFEHPDGTVTDPSGSVVTQEFTQGGTATAKLTIVDSGFQTKTTTKEITID